MPFKFDNKIKLFRFLNFQPIFDESLYNDTPNDAKERYVDFQNERDQFIEDRIELSDLSDNFLEEFRANSYEDNSENYILDIVSELSVIRIQLEKRLRELQEQSLRLLTSNHSGFWAIFQNHSPDLVIVIAKLHNCLTIIDSLTDKIKQILPQAFAELEAEADSKDVLKFNLNREATFYLFELMHNNGIIKLPVGALDTFVQRHFYYLPDSEKSKPVQNQQHEKIGGKLSALRSQLKGGDKYNSPAKKTIQILLFDLRDSSLKD